MCLILINNVIKHRKLSNYVFVLEYLEFASIRSYKEKILILFLYSFLPSASFRTKIFYNFKLTLLILNLKRKKEKKTITYLAINVTVFFVYNCSGM